MTSNNTQTNDEEKVIEKKIIFQEKYVPNQQIEFGYCDRFSIFTNTNKTKIHPKKDYIKLQFIS